MEQSKKVRLKQCGINVKKVATAVGNFVKKNWDIILGVALVIGSIALSIVTFGAGATIAGIVCGAVIGGAIGALSAYSRGENVLAGFVSGLVVGATGAVNPFAGGLAAAGMTFITERVNGNQPSKIPLQRQFLMEWLAHYLLGLVMDLGN